jgi:hypothetical protein
MVWYVASYAVIAACACLLVVKGLKWHPLCYRLNNRFGYGDSHIVERSTGKVVDGIVAHGYGSGTTKYRLSSHSGVWFTSKKTAFRWYVDHAVKVVPMPRR